MSNDFRNDTPQNDNAATDQHPPTSTTIPVVVYALLLFGIVVGFTSVIGVVVAYIYRGKGPSWRDEHYRYQIRTFWIGLLYTAVATLLTMIMIGFPLLLAITVWLLIRCVKGFRSLQEKRAPDNVDSWLF